MPIRPAAGSFFLLLTAVAPLYAQAPAEFEVASVKPNRLDDRIVTLNIGPGGRFAVRGYTLGLLIQQAWGIMGWGVTGGPDWIRSDRFDITAKASVTVDLTSRQLRPLLQNLLQDRFQLKLRKVPREVQGYELVVSRNGPKLQAAAGPEEQLESIRMWNSTITGSAISVSTFATAVGSLLGYPVIDKTAIPGLYDFRVPWTNESPDFRLLPALERELGLKLISRRVSVEVLVIDSAAQPSPD